MKPYTILGVLLLGVFFLFKVYQYPNVETKQVFPELDRELLINSMRQFSVENHRDKDASIFIKFLSDDDEEPFTEHFVLLAKDSGWIPFFVPGLLEVRYEDKVLIVDMNSEKKEYKVIIDPDGLIYNL